MKVPFLDLKAQYFGLKSEIEEVFRDILDNTAFVCGKYVARFEQAFAKAHKFEYFVGTSSGTAAVHLMLWAAGIGVDDEVIMPVNTFIATAEGVSMSGAVPVFVDNDPVTFNLDINKIEEKIGDKTKAILPVHLYGQPVDMDAVREIAESNDLLVFEDACQAHLAEYNRIKVGNFGEAAAFSFFPGKNLGAYGEAGGVATNKEEYYQKMIKIRGHGSVERYVHEYVGHNYRMDEIQGGVLQVKMKYLGQWTERRREIALKYSEMLADLDEIVCPVEQEDVKHVYHLFVVRVLNNKRNGLREYLNQKGIATGLHYPIPIHRQKAYAQLGYKKGDFPVVERQVGEILSLPIFAEMTEAQVEYVADGIRSFFSE